MSAAITKPAIDFGIVTRDAKRMLAFYQDTLNLPLEGILPMPSGGTMHRFKVGDSIIKIVQLDNPPAHDGVPGGIPAATGFRYLTISVSNLEELVGTCQAQGADVVVPIKTIRPGVTIAMVADPDGNWVEFIEYG